MGSWKLKSVEVHVPEGEPDTLPSGPVMFTVLFEHVGSKFVPAIVIRLPNAGVEGVMEVNVGPGTLSGNEVVTPDVPVSTPLDGPAVAV